MYGGPSRPVIPVRHRGVTKNYKKINIYFISIMTDVIFIMTDVIFIMVDVIL